MFENFQAGGTFDPNKTTRDFCASAMGGFCTPERERVINAAKSAQIGAPIRYTWESVPEFLERTKMIPNQPIPQKHEQMGDPEIFRAERRRLLRQGTRFLTKDQKKQIHELDAALGEPLTDFPNYEAPSDADLESERAFLAYFTERRPPYRMRMLKEITDRRVLRNIIKSETFDGARKAAEKRLEELGPEG